MADPSEKLWQHDTWLLRYIVTAETAALVMMLTFYATGYQSLVTKDELKTLPYPFLPQQAIISTHIRKSETTFESIAKSLIALNLRIEKDNHEKDLRITILERQVKALHR